MQASANTVGMLPDGGHKNAKKKKTKNSISESLGTVMKTAIIPTDSGRQSAVQSGISSDSESTTTSDEDSARVIQIYTCCDVFCIIFVVDCLGTKISIAEVGTKK